RGEIGKTIASIIAADPLPALQLAAPFGLGGDNSAQNRSSSRVDYSAFDSALPQQRQCPSWLTRGAGTSADVSRETDALGDGASGTAAFEDADGDATGSGLGRAPGCERSQMSIATAASASTPTNSSRIRIATSPKRRPRFSANTNGRSRTIHRVNRECLRVCTLRGARL